MSLLEVRGVQAGYGDLQALWGVDLGVDEGEWVTLLGLAGAGKTTLMKTLAGTLAPTSGTIRFRGRDLDGVASHERVALGMSLVPEGRRLFAGMTVVENLTAGAHATRSPATVAERLDRVFGLFPALRERRRQVVGTLSGGEQQMCAVGRALMSGPALLLVDELSLGLAPVLVDRLMEALAVIREQGTTLFIVEQDVRTALRHADRGYVMRQGKIVHGGSNRELLSDADFQEAFLGH